MTDPLIEVLPIEQAATPDPNNINRHTARGGALVVNSLQRRGAFRSIASAGKNAQTPVVYAGNLTLEKAVEAGFTEVVNVHVTGNQLVNVVRDDVAPGSPEAIALGLEDNESASKSLNYDIDLMAQLAAGDDAILKQLRKEDKIFNSMLEGMGLKDEPQDAEPQIDRAAELLEKWQVKTGDLWRIGEHRLLCGDSTKREDVERVMGGEKADMVFTDPPYGMNLQADYSALPVREVRGNYYDNVIGDDKEFDPSQLLELFAYCKEQFWWGADYYASRLPDGGSWIVWAKRNEGTESMIGNHFEVCWSKESHRREIIYHHWAGYTAHDKGELRIHPTQKSIEVCQKIIGSAEGNIVADPFAGSGTTLIACQNLGRKCRAIEISPAYCAVTLERMATAFPGIEIERV